MQSRFYLQMIGDCDVELVFLSYYTVRQVTTLDLEIPEWDDSDFSGGGSPWNARVIFLGLREKLTIKLLLKL